MDSLHIESMAENKVDALLTAEVGEPVPAENAFDRNDESFAEGCDSLEEGLGLRADVAVKARLSGRVETTEVHASCM